MEKNVTIIDDPNGQKIVVIHDIIFKGRQNIEWDEVEKYLKQFVGEHYDILKTEDMIHVINQSDEEELP